MKRIISLDDVNTIYEMKKEYDSKRISDVPSDFNEFINSFNISDTIYVNKDKIVPFCIVGDSLIVCGESTEYDNANKFLDNIDYDLTKLRPITLEDIINNRINMGEYIILNSQYYML